MHEAFAKPVPFGMESESLSFPLDQAGPVSRVRSHQSVLLQSPARVVRMSSVNRDFLRCCYTLLLAIKAVLAVMCGLIEILSGALGRILRS